jgi:rubredoxin
MKNAIYAIVIVVCLVLAVVIFLSTRSGGPGGLDQIQRGEMIWLMCNNPACKTSYEIDKKDYFVQIDEKVRANPLAMQTPALVCEKCGKPSVFRAVKCEQCGHMFFYGNPNDFNDRCPECKYSKIEAERKARVAGGTD